MLPNEGASAATFTGDFDVRLACHSVREAPNKSEFLIILCLPFWVRMA